MKVKSILITLFILLAVSPAQADAATFSLYRPHIVTSTGLTLYNTNGWTAFREASFDTKQEALQFINDRLKTTDESVPLSAWKLIQGQQLDLEVVERITEVK